MTFLRFANNRIDQENGISKLLIDDMNFDESFPKKARTYKTIIKHLNYMNADSDFKIAFDVLFSKYIKI